MINSILDNCINKVNYYQPKIYNNNKVEKNDKNIENYLKYGNKDESITSEQRLDFLLEFTRSIHNNNLKKSDIDKKLENLSYKYKEIYDQINKKNLSEDERNKNIENLNLTLKMVVEMEVSNKAFVAKSNEIHDFIIADISKYVTVNPEKEKHDNILKNHTTVTNYLDNLEKTLKDYSDIFYESFINDIKNNSVDKSFKNSLEKMKAYDQMSISYEAAKVKAVNLSKKLTEMYKYI